MFGFAAYMATACTLNRISAAESIARPYKTFAKSSMRAVSPNGKEICLEDWYEKGYPLRVWNIESGQTTYTGRFGSRTLGASFFADGRSLLVEALGSVDQAICGVGRGNCASHEAVVDLSSGRRAEKVFPVVDDVSGWRYYALDRQSLLGAYHKGNPYLTETLAIIDFPENRERIKVPYATQPRKPRPVVSGIALSTEYGFGISANRKVLAYAFDNVLVCRRTDDLSVRWTKEIASDLKAFGVALSADGGFVAAAFSDNPLPSLQRESYIVIYRGSDGVAVKQMPRIQTDGFALSPDGKRIATTNSIPDGKGGIALKAEIVDIASKLPEMTITHDFIKHAPHQLLQTPCSVAFTSDGNYLITSSAATKIWHL